MAVRRVWHSGCGRFGRCGAARRRTAAEAAPPAAKVDPRVDRLKSEAAAAVDGMATFTQQMVDQIFSYGELGFQEHETHRYLVDILKKNGFTVEEGIAGIPTAFMATWGSGKPVIALGSDIDGIPQSSQKPGVAYHDPLIEGGAGPRRGTQLRAGGQHHRGDRGEEDHGAREAARARSGSGRAPPRSCSAPRRYFVRDGFFKDVDVALFAHVSNELAVSWGDRDGHRPGVGRVHVPRRDRALRRRAVARQERARRRRADEHRLELPARAPAARAPLALRRSPTAAISRTSCRAPPRSGTTSARRPTRRSRSSGRSATTWPRPRR